ncbi:helix-turn-helix domain-containing protein [Virgibacillus sp. AGTR]|uniref:Helix-turn-helix domain-containing protein n=1 Tax=Virgibacillus salarius TaxID=447199 RepID=A0A941DY15_9BACI|nr:MULTISPECIES: helix-turn-helix domain-containing protein [Virgibacillus]MBR7797781.1 helix-turn-helix domain-containing protein [Virgibacillus salarius]MCC2252106.1 helix-turn-helix domain-containing protein [Virgibacillus sp. AGTR]NAZ10491.1 helix-turn-helix domain-containing protein [Agaribacter marinus]QRZ17384.1 helix-turn-helix domain-containing protein [Virgibacillus sp. AGTR]
MTHKSYSVEWKYEVLMAFKNGLTHSQLSAKYQVNMSTVYRWVENFEKDGILGLKYSKTFRRYPNEIKAAAVKDYISGTYSMRDVLRKYHISSKSVLSDWIKKYNGHRELKDARKGRVNAMTKGRKRTWKERIEIVQAALGNDKNYQQTAQYHVSYQQVYQ